MRLSFVKKTDGPCACACALAQVAAVQYIIDSIVDALAQDPNRRFIYVEQVSSNSHFVNSFCSPVNSAASDLSFQQSRLS